LFLREKNEIICFARENQPVTKENMTTPPPRFPRSLKPPTGLFKIVKGSFWRFKEEAGSKLPQKLSWVAVQRDRIKGAITTYQQSCPCVEISVYEVDEEGNADYMWQEESLWQSNVTLGYYCKKENLWWVAEYTNGTISKTAKIEQRPTGLMSNFKIEDECGLCRNINMNHQ
jgi:hypothetical protein